ncbi:MAG: hypothetical protein LBF08_01455 [Dysgonamonadaceae bacterium]|nr:hypothetical protein [Dysgonamonadaceae bacterium]
MKTIFFSQAKTLASALLSLVFAVGVSAAPTVISTDTTISGNNNNGFVVETGDVEVTLNNVSIAAQSMPAIEVKSGANLRLFLAGNRNSLRVDVGYAGIAVNAGATLTIEGYSDLIVIGGKVEASGKTEMAGIGGTINGSGTLIINDDVKFAGTIDNSIAVQAGENNDYHIVAEIFPKLGSDINLSDYEFVFLGLGGQEVFSYNLQNAAHNDGKFYLFVPEEAWYLYAGNAFLRRNEETLYTNLDHVQLRGGSNVLRFGGSADIHFSLADNNPDGLGITAALIDNSNRFPTPDTTNIESGSTHVAGKNIRFEITGVVDNDKVYQYRWECTRGGNSYTDTTYTNVPYTTIAFDNSLNMKCAIDSCYLITFKSKEGTNVSLSGSLRNMGDRLDHEGVLYGTLNDELTIKINENDLEPDTYYEHSVTVNGEVKQLGVVPIEYKQIITGPIDVEYSVIRMKQIRFESEFSVDSVTFSVQGKYEGNTYNSLRYDSVDNQVNPNDWVTPGGNLILTAEPNITFSDNRIYRYRTKKNGNTDSLGFNEVKIKNVPFDKEAQIEAVGPYYPVTFSLLDAPAGTTIKATYGEFTEEITADTAWQDVQKIDTILYKTDFLTLMTILPPDDGIHTYEWSVEGEGKLPNILASKDTLLLPDFAFDRKLDIKCEFKSSEYKIQYAVENVPGVRLVVTYNSEFVINGTIVSPDGKLSIIVAGDSAHLYRYAWEGVDGDGKVVLVDTLHIDTLRRSLNIKCVPQRIQSSNVLESLIVDNGDEKIGVLDGDDIIGVTVGDKISKVIIEATPFEGANVQINGVGEHTLAYGENTITVTVVWEIQEVKKDYVITIFREYPNRCGNSVFWERKGDTLIISGSGSMYTYAIQEFPWYNHSNTFKVIVLEEGVNFLGEGAFFDFDALTQVINRNIEPQEIDLGVFHPTLQGKLLYVPAGTEQTYMNALVWKNFNIVGVDLTGITSPDASSAAQVYADGQTLHINSPEAEQITVYSLTGNLLHRFEKPAGVSNYRIAASAVVIVRGSSGWVKKVVVR